MSNWHIETLVKQIDRHIEVAYGSEIIIVMSLGGRKKYGLELNKRYGSDPRIYITDLGKKFDGEKLKANSSIVLLVSDSISDSRSAYANLNYVKEHSVPVLFALPERRLADSPPGWEGSGIHYHGMFFLASQYTRTVRPTKGAYCEFGVYDGRTFALAYHALKNVCGEFFAFDSFKGICGAEKEEAHFNDGEYYANFETFKYNMLYCGVDFARIKSVQGFFQDTLKGRTAKDDYIDSISVLHIDTDVYVPALLALEYSAPAINDGALMLFDDYDQLAASNERGERRAFREFLDKHTEFEAEPYRNYGVFGRSFIVHRNSKMISEKR